MLSYADLVASLGQSTEDTEDSDDDACDPLPSVTFHQAHSDFLDVIVGRCTLGIMLTATLLILV